MIELNKIYCEDCLETLKRIPDNFVDSIITDPPYGLEFMGRAWDKIEAVKDERFCSWLGGFIDGEGNFDIHKQIRNSKEYYYCRFEITLREDDNAILELIKRKIGGKIYYHDNKVRLELVAKEECKRLTTILEQYPLQAKKKRDFDIWRRALKITVDNDKKPDATLMKPYWEALRATRKNKGIDESIINFDYGEYFHYKWAKECLRVLKPGGHILAFGGTRTYHRMACAIEDAGFEIRDQIQWLYSTGFPKSLNIKKKIEEEYLCQFIDNAKIAEKQLKHFQVELNGAKIGFVLIPAEINQEEDQENLTVIGKVENLQDRMDMCLFESTEKIDLNMMLSLKKKLEENLKIGNKGIILMELKTIIDLKIWKLFQFPNTLNSIITTNHTALKPSNEPICMARKPLSEKTVAENVLKWGTGGLNIDGGRIDLNGEKQPTGSAKRVFKSNQYTDKKIYGDNKITSNKGRFPSNVILNEQAAEVLDEQVGIKKKGASRFFYIAKASKSERNEGLEGFEKKFSATMNNGIGKREHNPEQKSAWVRNNHETVKPIALMRYLCRLVTPPKGTIYDPFIGSGTTGIAAGLEGFNFIGSEISPEYVRIAEKRIAFHRAQLKLQYE